MEVVVALVLLAAVASVPFLLARLSPHRGVRGSRPRHPFRVPPPAGRVPTDDSAGDHLDLPPVDRRTPRGQA